MNVPFLCTNAYTPPTFGTTYFANAPFPVLNSTVAVAVLLGSTVPRTSKLPSVFRAIQLFPLPRISTFPNSV